MSNDGGWSAVGRSVERDIEFIVGVLFAAGMFAGIVASKLYDWLVHRHAVPKGR